MANSKYNQVIDLVASGRLNWPGSIILGCLVTDASFNAANKKFSDLGVNTKATTRIQGLSLAPGGMCMGYPAFFNTVEGGVDYQMILVQDVGGNNPNLLAFYDTDETGGAIRLDHTGTLVVRPTTAPEQTPAETSTDSRLWMRL
jgi:hypothetical protein